MAALHRRSRLEQRECDSPEVSLKQQRINTASKARAVAHLSSNSATADTSPSSSPDAVKLSPQERALVRLARVALCCEDVQELLGGDKQKEKNKEREKEACCGLPVSVCPLDKHLLQRALLWQNNLLQPLLPPVPDRKDFCSLQFLFSFSALLASHSSALMIKVNNINAPLFESDPSVRSSVEYTATTIFDKFAACHSLLQRDIKTNGVSKMTQVELAVLLMFLSKASNPAEYFAHKVTTSECDDSINVQALDVVANCLLSALGDKTRNPKQLSMAVACLAFIVDYHSMASRVLTSSNSCQLVKLLLSKCVYPNESAAKALSRPDSETSGAIGFNNTTDHTHSQDINLPTSWEVTTSRMGLRKLLSLQKVMDHSSVRKEISAFVVKWWTRLQQATLNTGSLTNPAATVPTSLPPAYESALDQNNNMASAASQPIPLSPAAQHALDALTDIFSCTDDHDWSAFSSEDVLKLVKVTTSSKSEKGSRSSVLPPALAMVHAAFLASPVELTSPSFLVHFITSTSDPRVASSATELAYSILRVLRCLLVHPALLAAVKKAATKTNNNAASPMEMTAKSVYERLCKGSASFARDLFQHTLRAMESHKHIISCVDNGIEGNIESDSVDKNSNSEQGPFLKVVAAPGRPPLGEVSLSLHNEQVRNGTIFKGNLPVQGDKNGENAKLLRMVWEPIVLAHIRLLQECTQFAAITMKNFSSAADLQTTSVDRNKEALAVISSPACQPASFEAHKRLVVANWVYGSSDIGKSSSLIDTNDLGHSNLGLRRRRRIGNGSAQDMISSEKILVDACHFFAKSISTVNREEENRNELNSLRQKEESKTTAGASSTVQILHRLSGALVGVMDVLSCLVLDSNRGQTSKVNSPVGAANIQGTEMRSIMLQALSDTFHTYSDSVGYAVETCSTFAKNTLQNLTGVMTGHSSTSLKGDESQQEEPLAHLLYLVEMCDTETTPEADSSEMTPSKSIHKRLQAASENVSSPSFMSPRIARLAASTTTPFSACSMMSEDTTSSLSPLPLVIQKRLAYSNVVKDDANKHSHTNDDSQDDEEEDEGDTESISESITVINEEKLCERLSARLQLSVLEGNKEEAGYEKAEKSTINVNDEILRQLKSNMIEEEVQTNQMPSPVLSSRSPSDFMEQNSSAQGTPQHVNGSDEETIGGCESPEDLSKTMTMSQTQLPDDVSTPVVDNSKMKLYPPFYAGSQMSTSKATPSSTTTRNNLARSQSQPKMPKKAEFSDTPSADTKRTLPRTVSHNTYKRTPGSDSRRVPELHSEADVQRCHDSTQMRMNSIAMTIDLEEKTRELQACKVALEEMERSKQHWQWRAEDVERKISSDEARMTAVRENNDQLSIEVATLKLAAISEKQEKENVTKRLASMEGLLEEAWTKVKALSKRQEMVQNNLVKAEAESSHLKSELQTVQGENVSQQSQSASLEKEVSLLSQQLDAEREARDLQARELEKVSIALSESRAREKVTRTQLDAVLVELDESRTSCAHSTEAAEKAQSALQSHRAEYSALQTKCEAEMQIAKQLKQESIVHATEKANQKAGFLKEVARLERQSAAQVEQQANERRRNQQAISEIEQENAVLQEIVSSEKTAYTRLEAEHRSQTSHCDTLAAELAALQLTAETLRSELQDRTKEVQSLRGELGKHRELISYINKISHEGEGNSNKADDGVFSRSSSTSKL